MKQDSKPEGLADPVFDDSSTSNAINAFSDDPHEKRANSTGLKTTGQYVNAAQADASEDDTFNQQYAALLVSELGAGTVDSHRSYVQNVPTDNSVRYMDKDIQTNYVPYSGLSLSRLKAPAVNASSSTQIQGIDVNDYNRNVPGSIRSYIGAQ